MKPFYVRKTDVSKTLVQMRPFYVRKHVHQQQLDLHVSTARTSIHTI